MTPRRGPREQVALEVPFLDLERGLEVGYSLYSLVLTLFSILKYKATANARARHLVNRGSLGLLPARTHVIVLGTFFS